MEQQSPVGRVWELGKSEHDELISAVVLAVIGSVCGMVPYAGTGRHHRRPDRRDFERRGAGTQ